MPGTDDATIRPIEPRDDAVVAGLIRDVLGEFRCTGDGFSIHDPEVDAMSASYGAPRSRFYVVECRDRVLGCGGFAPLRGADPGVAELRKMYFRAELRGRGIGERLLRTLLGDMRAAGFRLCYLETITGMDKARRLYERLGFRERTTPLGATGHGGCDRWFELAL